MKNLCLNALRSKDGSLYDYSMNLEVDIIKNYVNLLFDIFSDLKEVVDSKDIITREEALGLLFTCKHICESEIITIASVYENPVSSVPTDELAYVIPFYDIVYSVGCLLTDTDYKEVSSKRYELTLLFMSVMYDLCKKAGLVYLHAGEGFHSWSVTELDFGEVLVKYNYNEV